MNYETESHLPSTVQLAARCPKMDVIYVVRQTEKSRIDVGKGNSIKLHDDKNKAKGRDVHLNMTIRARMNNILTPNDTTAFMQNHSLSPMSPHLGLMVR
jgi:hypothetical protein